MISIVIKSVNVSVVHVSISIRNKVKYRNRIDNMNTNSQTVNMVLDYYALSIIVVVIAITIISIICYSNQSPPMSHSTLFTLELVLAVEHIRTLIYALPLFKYGSDWITYAPDIITIWILYIIYCVQFSTGVRRTGEPCVWCLESRGTLMDSKGTPTTFVWCVLSFV